MQNFLKIFSNPDNIHFIKTYYLQVLFLSEYLISLARFLLT